MFLIILNSILLFHVSCFISRVGRVAAASVWGGGWNPPRRPITKAEVSARNSPRFIALLVSGANNSWGKEMLCNLFREGKKGGT